MKKVLHLLITILIFSSCSNIIIPYYTTVDKITKVNPGMTKQEVVATLEISPYEVFHGIEEGCEIHQFKYKHKEIQHGTLNSYSKIKGDDRFVDPSNLYVYYRDGRMESLVTDDGKKGGPMVLSFANELVDACNGPKEVYGCMDREALNYNKEATHQRDGAVIESGSTIRIGDCEYCACDYIVNRRYDAKKECGERCIPLNPSEEEEELVTITNDPECTLCDLAEKENAQININLDFDNEEPEYNGYISKLFGNNVHFKKKKKSKKQKLPRISSGSSSSSSSSDFGIGVGLRDGGLFLAPKFSKPLNSKLSSETSFSYFLTSSTEENNAIDLGDYGDVSINNKMMLSQAFIFDFKWSLGIGISSGVGVYKQQSSLEESPASLGVYPLSLVVNKNFGRFGIRYETAIMKLQNIKKGTSFGLTYNF